MKKVEINADCIACGSCLLECPEEAIEDGETCRVLPEKCTGCGVCREVCPVGAIEKGERDG